MNLVEHARAVLLQSREVVRAFGVEMLVPIWVLAAFLAVLSPVPVAAQELAKLVATAEPLSPTLASPDEIGRWIEELGNDAYTVRQAAASQLLAAGMSAREPLLLIVDGPDPERRAAARRLVALIDQSEFHRRLEAFAADTDGHLGLTLPGWEQYQKLVGSDPAVRALFVDMQRQEGALISAVFGASKRAPSELLESRVMRVVQWQNMGGNRGSMPALGSNAALLFLGSVAEIDVSDVAALNIEGLLQRPPIIETLKTDNRQDAVRRLAIAWLLHCPTKSDELLRNRLTIISILGLQEALPLPLAVVSGEAPHKHTQPTTRALAALIVGQFGRAEDADRLEPLLADATVCTRVQQQLPGQNVSVQVRDVALVVMVQLTGQRPADYGYINARVQEPLKTFQPQTLFRENDQQRSEAIAKWRQWRAAQKNATARPESK